MTIKKHLYSILILAIFTLLFMASAPQKKITATLTVPDFSYSPPTSVEPGSAGLRIALVEPEYDGNIPYLSKSPFKDFRESMSKDLEKILTARGYIIQGPYDHYDLMTYSDKQLSELGLFVDTDLKITKTSGGWENYNGGNMFFPDTYLRYKGTVTLSGKITLYVSETFTKQKLIVKSLPVPQQVDIPVETVERYSSHRLMGNSDWVPLEDSGVHNPIANALVDFYSTTMKRTWDMLPKEELIRVKEQVPKIRLEAGFIKR